jgi:phosphopantothenate synthetase
MDEEDEDDIVPQAIAALNAATQAMLKSGRPTVLVEGNQLVLIEGDKRTVLKELPPRPKVSDLVKKVRT